jgi:hypothetical protein
MKSINGFIIFDNMDAILLCKQYKESVLVVKLWIQSLIKDYSHSYLLTILLSNKLLMSIKNLNVFEE